MTDSEVLKVEELLELIGRSKILSSKDLALLCKTVKEFKGLRSENKNLLQDKVQYMAISDHNYGALQDTRAVLDKWGDKLKDKIIEINGKFYVSVGGGIVRELDI